MTDQTNQVVGFLFSENENDLLLINKNRPQWQQGLKNGIGGKCMPDETPINAMIREFKEETGLSFLDWKHFGVLLGSDYRLYCFAGFSDKVYKANSMTDEEIEIIQAWDLDSYKGKLVRNLHWIIPMAVSCRQEDSPYYRINVSI